MASPHNNQQVFSDHYLNVSLPERSDWQSLSVQAEPIMAQIDALFKQYKPSGKEAQAEYRLVRPILELLGHTFEVQASLATPAGTKTPDYVFYRDETALDENKGEKLDDALLASRAFGVGDAKYWDCPLDIAVKSASSDPFTNKNPSYQIAFYIQHSELAWGILTNGRLWRRYHKDTAHKLSTENPVTLKDIYDNSLILLYRLLFILYAEARNLLPINESDVYAENYCLRSIARTIARDLDAGRMLRSNSTRLYHQLQELFGFINIGDPPLRISTFNGGLFDPQRHPFLEQYELGDARLQQIIAILARVQGQCIDYRDLSVRNLGTIYEGLLEYHLEHIVAKDGWTIDLLNDKGERKVTGSFYTPDYIVKYIVDATVGPLLQSAVAQVKEQEHLYATMRAGLVGKYGKLANLLTARYFGTPIDTTLLKPLTDYATGRIALAPPQFKEWLEAVNSMASQRAFFHWELEFPEVFFDKHGQPKGTLAGFDAIVGNPPWIRQEMFSRDKSALERLYRVYHGVADLSTYFVELGNTYLKANGRFGFIIPNKFLRANYGEALRRYLLQEVTLERIVNFGDLPVFAEAVTYPLILLTTKQPPTQAPVKYTYLKALPDSPLTTTITTDEALISRTALTNDHWSLDGIATQNITEKMLSVGVPLGQYVENNIYYGIKTGFNEAFVIDRRTRDALIAQDSKSAEIIKPFVVGKDIKRYRFAFQECYIILTRIGTPIERYPAIFAHLQHYQAQLEARWDKGNHWWELRSCDYYEEFEKPKIIFPDIAMSCQFAFDTMGLYSTNTTYFMPVKDNQAYLIAMLNSSLTNFFFRSISALIRGDYLRFFTQSVAQIPIRRIAFTTPEAERAALVKEGLALFSQQEYEQLYTFVEARLAHTPEQNDVVHDLLAYLAEQMIALKAQREEQNEDILLTLEGLLPTASLQKLGRLWTPITPMISTNTGSTENGLTAKKQEEATAMLGSLATQQLDFPEHLGILNEEQWKWLLKRRLGGTIKNLPALVKTYRQLQPAIVALDSFITTTNQAIDRLTYRLYGLAKEEISTVEEILFH